jgi:hypothetical protein
LRRFHPSRTPGTRAGPLRLPEPFSSVDGRAICHARARFRPFVPFSPVLCCFAHARCRFHPSRPPVVVCTRLCRLVHLGGRRGTAGPSATPGPVFARLCRSVPLAARPGHLGLPVPFFAVFLSRSHPPKPFPSSLARFFCRPGALAICALRRPFPSSSGSRCRFQPFCAVSATRGALFIRLGLPSPSAPVCAVPCPWAHVLPVFHCLGHLGLPCRFLPSRLFRALR